jgi:hypothetical protein
MSEVTPDQRDREEELVDQGKQLVKRMSRSQLRLGKLALEYAPMGEVGSPSGAQARVKLYAERIEMDRGTLSQYRGVANAWRTTDVGDDEFSFQVLVALRRVGDKEGLLKRLREEKINTTKKAVDFAIKNGFLPRQRSPKGTPRRSELTASGRNKTRADLLKEVGTTLQRLNMLDMTPREREREDPLLAKVQAEAARLRDEMKKSSRPKAVA